MWLSTYASETSPASVDAPPGLQVDDESESDEGHSISGHNT